MSDAGKWEPHTYPPPTAPPISFVTQDRHALEGRAVLKGGGGLRNAMGPSLLQRLVVGSSWRLAIGGW